MAAYGAMSKYRQIGFLMEAGVEVDPNEYHSNKNKKAEIDKLLREGVIYRDKKKRYWVEQERDCFAIYARGLNITNSDRRVYWQWKTESEGIEVAEVVKTRWLEVRGSFWTMNLSPNARYKVTFRTKMAKPPSTGTPPSAAMPAYAMRQMDTRASTMKGQIVNLRLTLPDGSRQESQAELPGAKLSDNDPWTEVEVGQFNMTAQNVGRIEFSMEQLFRRWRTGLIIKCVEIKAV